MGNEDQLIGLEFFGWFGFPVEVAFDFFESCCLKVVEDFPVGEEAHAFVVSEHLRAIGGFYEACFVPPGYAVDSVVVFYVVNVHAAYSSGAGFLYVIFLHEGLVLF